MDVNNFEHQGVDADWFFLCENNIVFVASGGGKLPCSVLENWDIISELSSFFRGLPATCKTEINPNLNEIIGSKADANYLRDFVFMAERGLYAFDKTNLNNFNDTIYHLVASPKEPLNLDLVPEFLRKKLYKTVYHASLRETIDITNIL